MLINNLALIFTSCTRETWEVEIEAERDRGTNIIKLK